MCCFMEILNKLQLKGENKMLKKRVLGLLTGLFAVGMCVANVDVAHAETKLWDVHAQPGNYQTTQIIPITNHGTGYIATCDSTGGNAASKRTNILEYMDRDCIRSVGLNKVVEFTSSGKSITFKHNTMPSVDTVYMKVTLTYSNGTTASMSGTISTNG